MKHGWKEVGLGSEPWLVSQSYSLELDLPRHHKSKCTGSQLC